MIDLERYPREVTLRNGATLVFRPMGRDDVDRLWVFFQRIPPEDKMFFRQDVSRREAVQRWADTLDYGLVLPILALEGDRVVGDATLHRKRTGWKQRVGVVRVQIAPDYRHLGLGTAMVRELRHLGEKSALHYLMAEVIEEQAAAVRAFEKMGFVRGATYRNFVNDQEGGLHNLLVLLYRMSSSSYGPEEAYLALGGHTVLALFVAAATVLTVFIISGSYAQIIEAFPSGGGGYIVASKLLGEKAGVVSGSALVIDYVLTITISVAAGADAIFSFLSPS